MSDYKLEMQEAPQENSPLKGLTKEQQQLFNNVNQNINAAIASLMDVSNVLRDFPKVVLANFQLAEELRLLKGEKP